MDATTQGESWPPGPGEMAARLRAQDWGATPLGPPEAWPEELKAVVSLMLASPLVSSLAIGPERVLLYNDAAAPLYGERHPRALGRPLPETWPEAYGSVAHLYDRAFAGKAVTVPAQPLDVSRAGGEIFEVYLTPVRDRAGEVLAVHMTGFEVGARLRAEAALRDSEARNRALFERMAEGFAVMEAVRDEAGQVADFRHLARNPASERVTGLQAEEVVGRLVGEVLPPEDARYWIAAYVQVLTTGEPARFEHFTAALDRWFGVNVTPFGDDGVAVFYENITARKRAEAVLRASEERQAFLLRLSDLLRPLADPALIIGAATRLLGEGLGASRAYYAEWPSGTDYVEIRRDYAAPGLPSLVGRYPIEFFRFTDERFREGRTWVVEDVSDGTIPAAERDYCLAHGVAAWVDVPLVKGGTLQAALFLVQDAPRRWNATEIALVEETAERTWAAVERTRAEVDLRESEERFRTLAEGMPQLVWRAVDQGLWTWASPQWTEFTGQPVQASHGWGWLEPVHPEDREVARAAWERSKTTGVFEADYRLQEGASGEPRWFQSRATPVRDEAGRVVEWLGTSTDVQDLREIQERQKVLVAELQHRTRNLMAVVRGVMDKTRRQSGDLASFVAAFDDRLRALARVQGLLSRLKGNGRVNFDELIRTELAAVGAVDGSGRGERVTLDGRKGVRLPSGPLQTFALALHELATNAVKYGALGQPEGHLTVRWRLRREGPEPRLHVTWTETGVVISDPDAAPQGGGYGRELIERALPYQLGAETTYVLAPDGVRCTIVLPVSSTMEKDDV